MVGLSIYVLVALLIERAFNIAPQTSEILSVIDSAVCAVFLLDFFIQAALDSCLDCCRQSEIHETHLLRIVGIRAKGDSATRRLRDLQQFKT